MTTIYKPGNVPSDPRLIPTFLRGELAALKRGLESPEPITRRQVLHAPPAKAMDGDEIEADGVDWNPGYGPGKYVRRNGAWTRGDITGSTGTFSGALSAATGTFAGSLSAATGTFAGSLSAATGTFAGSLSAATGTFAGALSAASGTFSGDISTTGTASFGGATSSGGKTYAAVAGTGAGVHGGVKGIAGSSAAGVHGTSASVGTAAVVAENTAGGPALTVDGAIQVSNGLGASVAINVQQLMGYVPGNTNGAIPVSNGTLCTNLNAQYLNGNASTAFATSSHNHSGVYLPVAGTAADSSALGGYAASSWTRIVNGNVGTANASGAGFTMQMGTGLAPTYEVNCSSNNIILQTASDRTLKQDIEDEALGLAFVKALRPRRFRFISDPDYQQHGFIAQEVAEIATPAGQKDALAFTNPNGKMGINHLSLIGPLVKAVQELAAEVAALRGS